MEADGEMRRLEKEREVEERRTERERWEDLLIKQQKAQQDLLAKQQKNHQATNKYKKNIGRKIVSSRLSCLRRSMRRRSNVKGGKT